MEVNKIPGNVLFFKSSGFYRLQRSGGKVMLNMCLSFPCDSGKLKTILFSDHLGKISNQPSVWGWHPLPEKNLDPTFQSFHNGCP